MGAAGFMIWSVLRLWVVKGEAGIEKSDDSPQSHHREQ